jgi:signal transduction histidine kinase
MEICKILNSEEDLIINKSIYGLLNNWDSNDGSKSLFMTVIESLETQTEFEQLEKKIVRDFEVTYLEVSTYLMRNKNENIVGVLAVVHDFTKEKKLEEHLLHTERLINAGQSAAELAHEIKNPICSIKGLVQIMGRKYDLESSKHYEVITAEIDRINVLLQRFLTKTQNKYKFEKISIRGIIEEMTPIIEGYAQIKNINIAMDMQKEIPNINADRESIKQVIINIVQNGIDALRYGGKISISIWYDEINDMVKMEFKDNGTGIKPEYLDKIFEPFFTTKKDGSGLGLAISHSIIESHYGRLFAFNNLDGGATFAIELPAAECYKAINDKAF